jgi:protein SCO1/2
MMTARMAELQSSLQSGKNIRLVSFSVDPDHDAPKVLTEYAKKYGASRDQWVFLTGKTEAIRKLARESFKLTVEKNMDQKDDTNAVLHSTHFILVDAQRRIRGYYSISEDDPVQNKAAAMKILADAVALSREGQK